MNVLHRLRSVGLGPELFHSFLHFVWVQLRGFTNVQLYTKMCNSNVSETYYQTKCAVLIINFAQL